jgi:hypothetical protein
MTKKEYQIKYGIPFISCKDVGCTGLAGKKYKEISSERAKKQIEKIGKKNVMKRFNKPKKKTKDKNLNTVYSYKTLQDLKAGHKKFIEATNDKKIIFPCSICGREVEVKLIKTIMDSCHVYCQQCRYNQKKASWKKSREKNKLNKKPLAERLCKECGSAFMPILNYQVYCNEKCRFSHNGKKYRAKLKNNSKWIFPHKYDNNLHGDVAGLKKQWIALRNLQEKQPLVILAIRLEKEMRLHLRFSLTKKHLVNLM